MKEFIIKANLFLSKNIKAFYHTEFYGYGKTNNPDYLNILKNDKHHNWSDAQLKYSYDKVVEIIGNDIGKIIEMEYGEEIEKISLGRSETKEYVVTVAPRAKKSVDYNSKQLLFMDAVYHALQPLHDLHLIDVIQCGEVIKRHTNTRTTHLRRPTEFENDGNLPYPGITKDTCFISEKVAGRNIILIDDIYTETVNIDEDMIQALFEKGAKSVIFYAIGKTTHLI
jgi:hypothetical protein